MGAAHKGKRKIIVDEKLYWWFVEDLSHEGPCAHIIADDHSFIANCLLYCPVLRIEKGGLKDSAGWLSVPVSQTLSDNHRTFTPGYIAELIKTGIS